MSTIRRSAFALGFVVSFSACASSEPAPSFFNDEPTAPKTSEIAKQPFGGPSGPTTASVAPEVRSFIGTYCEMLQPTCWARSDGSAPSADPTVCQRTLLSKAYATELRFDSEKATMCLAASFWNMSFACGAVLKRHDAKPAGEACTDDSQCANAGEAAGLCVHSADGQRCANLTRGNAGDACIGTSGSPITVTTAFSGAICMRGDDLSCDPSGVCVIDPKPADGCEALQEGESHTASCDGRCVSNQCTDATRNADTVACFGFASMHSFDF